MSVALLLCPALVLQACATVSPAPEGAVLGRTVIEGGIELRADPDTVQHSADAQNVMRLREGRVVPLILVIRNVDAGTVVEVHSAAIALELTDGRVLRPINAVTEPLPAPTAPPPESQPAAPETSPLPPETPAAETPKTSLPSEGGISHYAVVMFLFLAKQMSPIWRPIVRLVNNCQELRAQRLGNDAPPILLAMSGQDVQLLFYIGILALATAPIWGPILIVRHYAKKAEAQRLAQRLRNLYLERLEDVPLAKGEAAGGLLYFAVEGDPPATLATATLVVPVRDADTAEERQVHLPLGNLG